MPTFQIAGATFELDRELVERVADDVLPEPVQEHYVVIRGRRYPPKQVLSHATGLDRADFTTHHARRILRRLGFVAARSADVRAVEFPKAEGPHEGAQAAALAPYVGQWVALGAPDEVLVAAETPQEVLAWLACHEKRAVGMFRVPASAREAEGLAPL